MRPIIFRPGEPGYDDELTGFQQGFALRSELVVGAADAEDVRWAVAYAAERGLPVGVHADRARGCPGPRTVVC